MTVVAATTDRVPDREIHNVQYRFVSLTNAKFFGYEPVAIGSQQVNIATVEKTLVDCAYHPEHCGGITELSFYWNRSRCNLFFCCWRPLYLD